MTQRSTTAIVATLGAIGALVLTACSSNFEPEDDAAPADTGNTEATEGTDGEMSGSLTILIGSSGDAETAAVEDAVAAWSSESGVDATVQVANDLNQQLSQGFAAGSPADLFYLSPEALGGYAENGSLEPYGDGLENKEDFYPSLVENFTYDGQFYCAPKDFSTLALVINMGIWGEAGLADDDIPTTWDELTDVAQTLATDDRAGLAFGPEYQRVGVFMAQAGGGLLRDGQPIADDPANVEALEYVQENFDSGAFAFASDVGAGWGGEALGLGSAAMVIEGNWITGAMSNDFPDVEYRVVALPEGPAGPGTLQFTNCWGMAADGQNTDAALSLVEHLTSTEQQLAFSEAFGPMPSIQSAADQWRSDNADLAAFLDGAEYAQFMPNQVGSTDVIADFNAQIESLRSADATAMLASVQQNLSAITE